MLVASSWTQSCHVTLPSSCKFLGTASFIKRNMRLFWLHFLVALLPLTAAVKSQDFKTCADSGFCRRGRALAARADAASSSWKSPYSIEHTSISADSSALSASVRSSLYPEIKFSFEIRIYEDGVVRVKMDEVGGLRKRYDEAAAWALIEEPRRGTVQWVVGKKDARVHYGQKKELELRVFYEPLRVVLLRDGREEIILNDAGLLHMEHFRVKQENINEATNKSTTSEDGSESSVSDSTQRVLEVNPRAWFEGDTEDGWWSEQFKTWTDTKPKGPESLSLDVDFPQHGVVYGIPEHATRLALPTTTGSNAVYSEPYRLYNLDVFEYLADSPMALYGAIPFLHAHSTTSTVGFLDLVASETWIDVSHPSGKSTKTHWISESGILDVFLLPGPTPDNVFEQYARLTGPSALPPEWALGYHQCRWNYLSSEDVKTVAEKFDASDIPFDVLWLDIEYAEDHKYFIWKKSDFPDPVQMINDIASVGRKMVVIVDPHLKRVSSYPVYAEASEKGILIKTTNGEGEFEGWCWSGSSSWVDFFHPDSVPWWISLFQLEGNGKTWHWSESTKDVFIWNDMNEPSIFNGPEITLIKDAVHHGGWEHRDVHNINGMLFHNTTSKALIARSAFSLRPFVLSRSYYAGSQRFGAIWTGDNMGTWEHMAIGIPMVLSNGIAGMTFSGADVGGFFGNPDSEMLVRWYQVGAFAPFFRAHAHIDTKRREPFLLEEPYKSIVRSVLRLRYSLLAVWYTAFREASVRGIPILRPHYVVFPKDPKGFNIDDQYFVGGSGLLVKPVTKAGVDEVTIYLADNQPYYNYYTFDIYRGVDPGRDVTVPAPLDTTPLLYRGGSIVPTRERPRRSTKLMAHDPFTLHVALDKTYSAKGELYLDDGETYANLRGDFIWRQFTASSSRKAKGIQVTSIDLGAVPGSKAVDAEIPSYNPLNSFSQSIKDVRVERLVVLGLSQRPREVKLNGEKVLEWTYEDGVIAGSKKEGTASILTVKDPAVHIIEDWVIDIID